jgi:hypothetical protein
MEQETVFFLLFSTLEVVGRKFLTGGLLYYTSKIPGFIPWMSMVCKLMKTNKNQNQRT